MATSASWEPPQPEIRASDVERHDIATFLRDRAVEGRLTPEELEERVGRALTAVTRGDLERLVADLPRSPARPAFECAQARPCALVPLGIAALVAVALPGLLGALLMTLLALGVALVAVLAAVGVAVAPFLLVIALAVSAVRRRGRYWVP